jgi:hypothetical protein
MFEMCITITIIVALYYALYLLCYKNTSGRLLVIIFGIIITLVLVSIILHKLVENSKILTLYWSTLGAISMLFYYNWPKVYESINVYFLKKLLQGADFTKVKLDALKLLESFRAT